MQVVRYHGSRRVRAPSTLSTRVIILSKVVVGVQKFVYMRVFGVKDSESGLRFDLRPLLVPLWSRSTVVPWRHRPRSTRVIQPSIWTLRAQKLVYIGSFVRRIHFWGPFYWKKNSDGARPKLTLVDFGSTDLGPWSPGFTGSGS